MSKHLVNTNIIAKLSTKVQSFITKIIDKRAMLAVNEKVYKPIVFINKPVTDMLDDVVGFTSQVETIKTSILAGAHMIGLIADYGCGKSSLTDMLAAEVMEKPLKYPPVIKVNMWDCLHTRPDSTHGENEDGRVTEEVSNLTKAFLFQLSNGKGSEFASYINKRLSKNYGTISFGVSAKNIWICFAIACIFYAGYLTMQNEYTQLLIMTGTVTWLKNVLAVYPTFIVVAVIFIALGLRNATIAFSHWKMQETRSTELNDIFDIYAVIAKKLSPAKGKKQIIVIEDLDRIAAKDMVVGFLKELYRFQSSLECSRDSFVFIVSIKPEALLDDKLEKGMINDDHIYSKIFDVAFSLKPIHFEDYDTLLLKLIENDTRKKQLLEELIGEPISPVLPDAFEWIKRGHNLTLRSLKDRLNQAIDIMVVLKNKQYLVRSSVSFKACAAIAFLESQYALEYYELIKKEEAFADLIADSYVIKNQVQTDKYAALMKSFYELFPPPKAETGTTPTAIVKTFSKEFANDLCQLIIENVFDNDFRMYFYTYPKGSYIKTTDEKELSNMLLLPTQHHNFANLDEIVERIYLNGNNNIITTTIKGLQNYPPVIWENDILLQIACDTSVSITIAAFKSKYLLDSTPNESYASMLLRLNRIIFQEKEEFLVALSEELIEEKHDEVLIDFRMPIVSAFKDNLKPFSLLMMSDEKHMVPQLTEKEVNIIADPVLSINLMSTNDLTEENFSYISSLLTSVNLYATNEEAYLDAEWMLKNFCAKIEHKVIATCLLRFLQQNRSINDEFFSVITSNIVETIAIASYLNTLPVEKMTPKYLEIIDKYGFRGGLREDILVALESDGKYYSVLLCRLADNSLDKINFTDEGCSVQIINSCLELAVADVDAFISIRKFVFVQQKLDLYKELYSTQYPVITTSEFEELSSTTLATSLVDTTQITLDNCSSICDTMASRQYTNADTIFLFQYLFDPTVNPKAIGDLNIIQSLAEYMDFEVISVAKLCNEEREGVAKYFNDAMGLEDANNAIDFMKCIRCLVPSLESCAQQSEESSTAYVNLIKQLDEVTDVSLAWLNNNYIYIGLSEKLCNKLYDTGDYQSYIIGSVLHQNNMILDSSIPFSDYVTVYTHVEELFPIMSDHWDFLEKLQIEGNFKALDQEHTMPIYKVRQYQPFFEHIFSGSNKEVIIDYISQMGTLASEKDSKAFQVLVCQPNILEMLGSRNIYSIIHSKLWNEGRHKAVFTEKWNTRWKTEIEEQEVVLL